MNILNYSLTSIVSYLGLWVGFILAIIAKEELKVGKKYFILSQKTILLLIFISLFIFIKLNYILILLVLALIVIIVIKNIKESTRQQYLYILLSFIFFISSKKLNLFVIESSLIFLYGLPTGTLLESKNKKEWTISLLKNIGFILITIILYLIF